MRDDDAEQLRRQAVLDERVVDDRRLAGDLGAEPRVGQARREVEAEVGVPLDVAVAEAHGLAIVEIVVRLFVVAARELSV